MDLSELKMTLNAYQKVSKSILSEYVKKEDLEEELSEYVREVTPEEQAQNPDGVFARKRKEWVAGVEEAPADGLIYGRQDKKWVEVDMEYKRPNILVFELDGLKKEYEKGEIVSVKGVIHQEENIVHIHSQKVYLYRDNVLVDEFDASDTMTEHPYHDEFDIQKDIIYRLEIESDIGNIYYKEIEVKCIYSQIMHSGENEKAELTAQEVENLTLYDFEEGKKYRYQLSKNSYIWWCTNFDVVDIKQDGLYSIDYIKVKDVVIGEETFKCYRTKQTLMPNLWSFTLEYDKPEPIVKVGDLRIGGSINEEMTAEELEFDLTEKDFEEDRVYTVNLSTSAYIWFCSPYELYIMDGSGMSVDTIKQSGKIRVKDKDFICYRTSDVLVDGIWRFKFEKI